MMIKTLIFSASVLAAIAGSGLSFAYAETKGPVTDALGVVAIEKGAPIVIGGYWVTSGPDLGVGIDSMRGAEIAFDELDKRIADHDIRFVVEDDGCSAEGGQTVGTKLAALPDVVAVLGPACSSAATAAAPILWKAGISGIGTASSAIALTAPDRKPEYQGFLRTINSDADQGFNDAEYFFKTLKCTTLATIHDGTPFPSQLVAAAAGHFKELGGEVVAEEAISPTDVDMRTVLTSIATKKPCVLYFPVFVAATAQIIRQVPEVQGLKGIKIMGGSAVMSPGMIEAAGPSVMGFTITNNDLSPDVMGKKYPAFVKKYTDKYGEAPINSYHAQGYDAAMMLAKAIEAVAQTDAAGNTYIGKKALNEALYATKDMDGN